MKRANAELATLAGGVDQNYRSTFKEYEGWRLVGSPWANALLQDVRPAAFLLLGAVVLVLLIACANLTNLFLARSTTRQRELAVRLALGAARGRLVRHLLTETVLLALIGALLGIGLAYLGMRGAASLIPAQLQMLELQATVNTRVLLWSLTLAIGTGLLVGVLPAVQATRTDPHESLKADGRAGTARGGSRLRSVLVVAQIALCVVLLMGAGLFMRTFVNIQRVDVGFEPRDVLTMRLTLPRERYPGDAAGAFFDNLVQRLGSLPYVRSVAAASQFPPMGVFDTQFSLDQATGSATGIPSALITVATPSYFETLRVPLRSGRTFSAGDTLTSPLVAIVNQSFVDRYLPGKDPLGQRIAIGSPQRPRPWTTIVGVAADYRNSGATSQVRPEIFTPVRQQTAWNQLYVLTRGDGGRRDLPAERAGDGSIARSGAANLFRPVARRCHGAVVVCAAHCRHAAVDLRGRRADPGSRRHLWRPVVHRLGPNPGDRRAHRRWRRAAARAMAGGRAGPAAGGDRTGSGDGDARRGRPGGGRPAVRDHPS